MGDMVITPNHGNVINAEKANGGKNNRFEFNSANWPINIE